MENITYEAPSSMKSRDAMEELRALVQRKGIEPHEAVELGKALSESYKMYDDAYLKCLLFPEDSEACRIPSKFPLSTANATQTWSFYQNTGEQGMGYVSVLPLDLSYRCAYTGMPGYDGNPTNNGDYEHAYVNECHNDDITKYYAQGRVVGCSVKVQYIGEAMTESGLLFGSHVFDSTLGRISEDVIENGYYITRGRPHEGIRLSYLPRDEGDLEYCGLDYRINHKNGDGYVRPKLDYDNDALTTGQLEVQIFQPNVQDFVNEVAVPIGGGTSISFKRPDQLIGQTSKRFQSNTPYQLVIGWVGMPPSKNWLRIDITRHIEVVPRMALRDLISTKKAKSDPQTVQMVQHIAEIDPRPLSNTVKRHEEAIAHHANVKPGDQVALSHSGTRSGASGSWIGGIMKGLLNAAGFVGQRLGPVGKVLGTGAQLLANSGIFNSRSDQMTGSVNQGLVGARF